MGSTQPYSSEQQKSSCGVSIGVVTNNKDPDHLGRVRLKFPWRDNNNESNWARIVTLTTEKNKGTYFLPEVGDEVLVTFDRGDLNQPYVLGALWNGKDNSPEETIDIKNNMRIIKSKSGHKIIFNDEQGSEKVEIHSKFGHQIILDDSSGKEKIEIKDKDGGNYILIDSVQNKISVLSHMRISLEAQMIEIKAHGTLDLKGGIVRIN